MRLLGRGVAGTLLLIAAFLVLDASLTRLLFGTGVAQPLDAADRVEVRTGADGVVHVITDPAAIDRLRTFIQARPGGWERSWHTPPVSRVKAVFYARGEIRGWFGAGTSFFQAPSPDNKAAMRRATRDELETFNRLLGLPLESHLRP